MVLREINRLIELYKQLLVSDKKYDERYKWEALKNFQDNWNIEADDFKTMYDKSLYSKEGNNLWAGTYFFPKAVMLRFIDHDKERVRQMFRDLYNEEEGIDKRIDRFVFNCDKTLEEVQEVDKSVKNHFHDGQRIVSLYLAFRYPEKYAIYKYTEFKIFMEQVQATNIPGTGEFERFFKVVRTIYGFLKKDSEVLRLQEETLNDDCYKGETLMLAQDFIFRTARVYMK